VTTGEEIHQLEKPEDQDYDRITAVAFSADGQVLIARSSHNTVWFWKASLRGVN